jgi:hypothetical protein
MVGQPAVLERHLPHVNPILLLAIAAAVVWAVLRFVDRFLQGSPLAATGTLGWIGGLGGLLAMAGTAGLLFWIVYRYPKGQGPSPSPERDVPTIIPTVLVGVVVVGGAAWVAAVVATRRRTHAPDRPSAERVGSDDEMTP